MTSGQKTAVSLLVSILVFAACLVFALMGGFDLIEIRYYEPRVVQNVESRLNAVGENFDSYIDSLENTFAGYAGNSSVSSYIERDVTEEDAINRTKITGALFDSCTGLDGIRIIESDGIKTHFSTYASDVLSETEEQISYKPYNTINELPFFLISTTDSGEFASDAKAMVDRCNVYYDGARERIIFSYPYFDHFTAYRGTLLFYVNADDFMRYLIAENVVSLNTRCALVAPVNTDANYQKKGNVGFVFGIPYNGKDVIKSEVEAKWSKELYGVEQLVRNNNTDKTLVLVTSSASRHLVMGWVCDESEFSFSGAERTLILICIFITIFLIVFLVFNIKHDDMLVIQGRVRKFQNALITEYIQRKDNADWQQIAKELNYRKVDVNEEIKKSLGRKGKKHSKELDELLDESWHELFAAIGGAQSVAVIKKGDITPPPASGANSDVVTVAAVEEPEAVEELEDVEALEEVEDLEEVESLEEVEDLEEVEPLEEVEEAEPVEDLEEVEPLEEVEEAEPVEDLEEVEEVQPVETLEEVEAAEPVEVPEEVDPLEEQPVLSSVEKAAEKEPEPIVPAFLAEPVDELQEIGSFEKKTINKDSKFAEKFSIAPLDFTDLDGPSEELKTQE